MIRRRHVIYVQGYDPRGHVEYYRMFRGEYRSFLKLYGLSGVVEREPDAEGRHASVWTVTTEARGWQVTTTYEFLRWEDIIRRDFERPPWRVVPAAFGVLLRSLVNGVFFRIWRAHWRFALFIAYPFMLLGLWLMLGAGVGALWGWGIQALGASPAVSILVGGAIAAALFVWVIRATEPRTYILYLFQYVVSTLQYARRQRPDWDERLNVFAEAVTKAARDPTIDEVVIVGHSSGSFLAVDVLARALTRDPDLGRHGPHIALLTVGGNLPIVGFQPQAGWFRERLAGLAMEPSITWVDYQSRRDIMNFFRFDPVAGHRLALDRPAVNPTVVPVQFRHIVSPERFAWLQWHFFDLHFQFLRANERVHSYDYFMIVVGPIPLALRAASPDDAVAAVSDDEAAAGAAWGRLTENETAA